MCGIFGWFTAKPKLDYMYIYSILGSENQYKGSDSVGLVGFDAENTQQEIRRLAQFEELMKDIHEGKTKFKFKDQRAIISHVRKASKGEISKENIHPFTSGHITLAHNGTIDNLDEVKEFTKKDWDCDSRHLAYMMETQGHIKPAKGPATLVWYDTKLSQMNIVKFQRGIDVYFNKYIMLYSSHEDILKKINQWIFFGNLTKVDMWDKTHIKAVANGDKIVVTKSTCDWVQYADIKKMVTSFHHSDRAAELYGGNYSKLNKNNQSAIGKPVGSASSSSLFRNDNPYFNKRRKKGIIVP